MGSWFGSARFADGPVGLEGLGLPGRVGLLTEGITGGCLACLTEGLSMLGAGLAGAGGLEGEVSGFAGGATGRLGVGLIAVGSAVFVTSG